MEVEDEFLKTQVPTVVMYHKSFQHCEAEECRYHWNAKYMEPPTICYSGYVASEWGGIQKNKIIIGKTSYQMPIFAFIIWIAYRRLSLVLSANTCTWAITQEHMDLLKQYSYWDHILNSWKQLIDEATSQHQGYGQNE